MPQQCLKDVSCARLVVVMIGWWTSGAQQRRITAQNDRTRRVPVANAENVACGNAILACTETVC